MPAAILTSASGDGDAAQGPHLLARPQSHRGRRHQDAPSSYALYDNHSAHPSAAPISHSLRVELPSMFSYFATPPQNAWTHNAPHAPPPFPIPPPPPIAHKVWILDCKSCGTFLTNRGMKAVLLLRPNVSLFSTDALPINCSAYSSNPDVLRSSSFCRPLSLPSPPPRTCECLTQTLCCHGCGTSVGYMIVIPCSRCTSSITATNRATNGHRFVFHSGEIDSVERHYVPDEAGVIPFNIPLPSPAPPPAPVLYPSGPFPHLSSGVPPQYRYPPPMPHQLAPTSSSAGSSPLQLVDYLPSPPLEVQRVEISQSMSISSSISMSSSTSSADQAASAHSMESPPTQPFSLPIQSLHYLQPQEAPMELKESPPPRLKAGDLVYWHHLIRNGEIPGVQEDPRARAQGPSGPTAGR